MVKSAPSPLCACGCGRPVPRRSPLGRPRKYVNVRHQKRHYRKRYPMVKVRREERDLLRKLQETASA